MSDEQDSWFQSAFGLNVGGVADRIRSEAEEAAGKVQNVVQRVQGAVEGVLDDVVETVTDVAKRAAGGGGAGGGGAGGGGSPKTAAPVGGGTGSFPLSGSVGRGGQNGANDVKAVQQALGIGVDGQCGKQTIGAIEAFQRSIGQAKPDGRVDAGGATERALAGGAKGAAFKLSGALGNAQAPSLFDAALQGVKELGGKLLEAVGDEAVPLDGGLPDGGPKDAGPPDSGPADGGSAPDPIFADIDDPFNVRADDPAEFVNKGNEFLGEGIAGHMKTDTLTISNAETDSKGRIVRANLLVRTTTRRPRWTAGRTRGDEEAVIRQAEELIRGHEERHREIMKNAMRKAVKEMRGKSKDEADKILAKAVVDVNKEQNSLDAREGQIEIIQSAGRMTGARLVPARS